MSRVSSHGLNSHLRRARAWSDRLPLTPDRRLILLIIVLIGLRLALYAWLAGGAAALPDKLCHWDCAWYRGVAENGYSLAPKSAADGTFGQAGWAFFPLFPRLAGLLQYVLDSSFVAAGTLLSNLCLGAFAFIAGRYLRRLGGPAQGTAVAAFLLAYPYSFYLSIPYTEAIYAVLTVAAFWCLAEGRLLSASLFAALLSATRVTGVLLAPVIAWRGLFPAWRAWRGGDMPAARTQLAAAILPLAVAPAGLFAFMAYLYGHTGDGLAFYHIQRAWNRPAEMPWMALWQGLTAFDLSTFSPYRQESLTLDALSGIAALALAVRLCFLRRFAEGWFLASNVLVALSHGLGSMARYSLAQPLFMVFLFEAIWNSRLRAWFWEILAIGVVAQLFLVALWMRGFAFLH